MENRPIPPTPSPVQSARQRLGLRRSQLAELFGVDRSTVFRWERSHTTMEPSARRLLTALQTLLETRSRAEVRAIGHRVWSAIEQHGGLYALHVMLAELFTPRSPANPNDLRRAHVLAENPACRAVKSQLP